MRCVPSTWTATSTAAPTKTWDDSGSSLGGKPGSLWTIPDGTLKLMAAVPGYQPPDDLPQLREDRRNFQLEPSALPSVAE